MRNPLDLGNNAKYHMFTYLRTKMYYQIELRLHSLILNSISLIEKFNLIIIFFNFFFQFCVFVLKFSIDIPASYFVFYTK